MPTPALIKDHQLNLDKGIVTFSMPGIDPLIADSVNAEMHALASTSPNIDIQFKYESGNASITLQSNDFATLALNTTKVMTRRVQEITSSSQPVTHYASHNDISTVLQSFKEHAEKTASTSIVRAIDRLIAATEQIKRY